MQNDNNLLVIKSKKSVRKIRFGIVLKLSLFVIIIQLIVLLSLGTIFVDKESETLKKNIHHQVSFMLTNFKENFLSTARRINEITLRNITNIQNNNKQRESLTGNEIIALNNILKGYTESFSSEDESSGKFKVSEIMVVSPDGWIISHSRDDRWLEQYQNPLMANKPLASYNGISSNDLNEFNKIIFDSIPAEMENREIDRIVYFQTVFPVFYYNQNIFRNTPALVNSVDDFQLLYKKFLTDDYYKNIILNKDLHNTLKIFDRLLNEAFLYIEITEEKAYPVKLTKIGEEMLKLNLLTPFEIVYIKNYSDLLTKYIKHRWLYTILFKKNLESFINNIEYVFEKKYIDNFVDNIKPFIEKNIFNIIEAKKENKLRKIKNHIEDIMSKVLNEYELLTEKFPSIVLMNEIDKKIRVFTKEVGERGEQYYIAGLEPYDKYLKPFRDSILNALNIITEVIEKKINLSDDNYKKILDFLQHANQNIIKVIPTALKERVLLPIKIELMKYCNNDMLNINIINHFISIFRTIRYRLAIKTTNQIVDVINKLRSHIPLFLLEEFSNILLKKQLQDPKINTEYRGLRSTEEINVEKSKDLWEEMLKEISRNSFFKKSIRIIGERKNNNFTDEELYSFPFYAMLFKVRQNWRAFTNFDEIPVLKLNFSDEDKNYYLFANNRFFVLQKILPFIRKSIAEQLLYRENNITGYQANAIRSMHPFSVEDIAKLYPYIISIKKFIYYFDEIVKTNTWETFAKINNNKLSLNLNFIQDLFSSMMAQYKLGYIVLRVRQEQYETFLRRYKNTTIDYSISILLRSIFLSIIFSTIFLKSLKILTQAAEEIGQGNLDKKIILKGSDEFGQLADTLTNMAINLKIANEEIKDKTRMEEELKFAQGIQEMLLPKETPQIAGFSFAGYYKAQTQIGGDYYDYLTDIGKNHIGLVIADVSGHGVGAGIVMTMIRSVLRTEAINKANAASVIKKINPIIHRDTSSSMYATLWYGVLNTETKILNYTVAGHNPAVIFNPDKKSFMLLKTGGMPIGLVDSNTFDNVIESHSIQLQSGDILIQYTDGVTEAMNKNQELYEEERFFNCIKRIGNFSAEKIIKLIVQDIEKFTGGIDQSDDITLLVMKVE